MKEILPGIYKVLLQTDRGNTTEINIFIIPGKKRGKKPDDRCRVSG